MLPNNDEALVKINERIATMERRLKNAKEARDSYVDFLRGKYPNWRPTIRSSSAPRSRTEPLISRLATSDYHWDQQARPRPSRAVRPIVIPEMDLPSHGPLLEVDLRNMKRRLNGISSQMKELRSYRMALSNEQYYQLAPFSSQAIPLESTSPEPIDRMEAVRQRLSQIDMIKSSPVTTPTSERRFVLEIEEERQQMVDDIRSGKMPLSYHISDKDTVEEPAAVPPPVVIPPAVRFSEPVVQAQAPVATVPPATVPPATVSPATVPPPATVAQTNYANVMNLLSQKNDSSSDSDAPPPVVEKKPAVPAPTNLLSQYLVNNAGSDSSDEDNTPISRPTAPSAYKPRTFVVNDDSDDFFD